MLWAFLFTILFSQGSRADFAVHNLDQCTNIFESPRILPFNELRLTMPKWVHIAYGNMSKTQDTFVLNGGLHTWQGLGQFLNIREQKSSPFIPIIIQESTGVIVAGLPLSVLSDHYMYQHQQNYIANHYPQLNGYFARTLFPKTMTENDIRKAILNVPNSLHLIAKKINFKHFFQWHLYAPTTWLGKTFVIKVIANENGQVITALPLSKAEGREYIPAKNKSDFQVLLEKMVLIKSLMEYHQSLKVDYLPIALKIFKEIQAQVDYDLITDEPSDRFKDLTRRINAVSKNTSKQDISKIINLFRQSFSVDINLTADGLALKKYLENE